MKSREWGTAAVIAVAVVIVGLVELSQVALTPQLIAGLAEGAALGFLICLGLAVGVCRWAPGVALGLAWLAGIIQLFGGIPVLLTEAATLAVLFAAARWGAEVTVALAACSIWFVPVLALAWFRVVGVNTGVGGRPVYDLLSVTGASVGIGRLLMLGLAVLGLPFVSGLALRFRDRARSAQLARRTAESQAEQAREIARLQEAQNRLARDVHDVVGHSLTVILAQAESAQFIDDPERLKQTMQTIAHSARRSLRDVRQVLTDGQEISRGGDLDALIEGVRAGGPPLVSTEVGTARPLPPELAAVAYRVLQEMLTNAIKHGRRDRPVVVERRWPEAGGDGHLRILVNNRIDESEAGAAGDPGGGQGLAGMRRRLESVGGGLQLQRDTGPDGPAFTAIAFVPVRTPAAGWSR